MSVAMPTELQLIPKPVAPSSRTVQVYALPINGSKFNSMDPIKIVVPTRARSFLVQSESYFRVRLAFNTSAVSAALTVGTGTTAVTNVVNTAGALTSHSNYGIIPDGHISAIINRMQVSVGSQLLENTEHYNLVHSLMGDLQFNREQKINTTQAIMGGATDRDYGMTDPMNQYLVSTSTAAVNADITTFSTFANPTTVGGSVLEAGQSETYCFAPISGVIGTNCTKFFPMYAINEGLIIDLYLENFKQAFKLCSNVNTTLTGSPQWVGASVLPTSCSNDQIASAIVIDRIEYVASFLELDESAFALYKRMNPSTSLNIPCSMYRQYQTSIPQFTSSIDMLVAARFSSIKSVFATLSPSALINSFVTTSIQSRTKDNLQYASLRINGIPFPQKPLDFSGSGNSSQALMELEKCIRNTASYTSALAFTAKDWKVGHANATAGNNAQLGAFALGFNLDQMRWTSTHGGRSGLATMDAPYYLSLQFDTTVGASPGNQCSLYATVFNYIDADIVIDESTGQCVPFM